MGSGVVRSPIVLADPEDLQLAAYDYLLPEEHIAQTPAVPRDSSRLLVVETPERQSHWQFRDLPQFLQPGDLLVMNNTRVLPARLYGQKRGTGAAIEVLLLEEQAPETWLALVKPGKRLQPGSEIGFPDAQGPLRASVLETDAATGGRSLRFSTTDGRSLWDWLDQLGEVPLPPYITERDSTPEQYQTIYGDRPGAVAAPTAGLHFTPELLKTLQLQGIQQAFVTLHVGVGTFRPVESSDIRQHQMHAEWVEISPETVEQIRATQSAGGRIVSVGTTTIRTLEGIANHFGRLQPYRGKINLYIYPGYQWRIVDALITNFHLPRSSLMMLVSALVGRKRLLALYQEAMDQGYRFYSFGDAMLILPEARLDRSR
jgi:S-adenosylmethionine:tRNA ribosyltransferase-isomerase